MPSSSSIAVAMLLGVVASEPALGKVVARDIRITIDATDPSHARDVGRMHEARIFYDDAKIDPITHRVVILHEQHTPMHIPFHPDAAEMPVGNAWLDLSAKPYRYHMAASPAVKPLPNGATLWKPYAILFDEDARRMTIRRQSDGGLELAGDYIVGDEVMSGPEVDFVIDGSGPPPGMKWPPMGMMPGPDGIAPSRDGKGIGQPSSHPELAAGNMGAPGMGMPPGLSPDLPPGMHMPAPPPPLKVDHGHLVALAVDVTIDQVAPEDEGMYRVGDHDVVRIVYNDADVDPVMKTVPILEESHLLMGRYHANRDTGASSLDLSQLPYRLTYASAPFHGRPLAIMFEGASQRMAVLARPNFHMLIAGHYAIDATPVPYDPARPEN